jgi:hypothetical protein
MTERIATIATSERPIGVKLQIRATTITNKRVNATLREITSRLPSFLPLKSALTRQKPGIHKSITRPVLHRRITRGKSLGAISDTETIDNWLTTSTAIYQTMEYTEGRGLTGLLSDVKLVSP